MNKQDIVNEARQWLGTPFHHQASLKGVGTDCYGLIRGVANNLGIARDHNPITNYSRVPNGDMEKIILQHCTKIPVRDRQAGDIINFAWGKEPQHLGILTEKDTVIHAYGYEDHGKVVETSFVGRHLRAVRGIYRFKEFCN